MKEIHFKKIQWKKPDLKGKWQKLKNMKPGDIKAHLKKQHERRQQILEKRRNSKFAKKMAPYYKIMNRFSLPLQALWACIINFIIEALSRHSAIAAWQYMTGTPLVFLYNAGMIFVTLLIAYLVRRRVFTRLIISALWLFLGVVNGVMLAKRVTPFNAQDLKTFTEGLSLFTNYFSVAELVMMGIGVPALLIWLVAMWRRAGQYEGKMHRIPMLIIVVAAFFGYSVLTNVAVDKRIISTYFGNIAFAYQDYGLPYCFSASLFNTGISEPNDYNKDTIEKITDNREMTESTSDNGVRPNVLFVQLESFFDPIEYEDLQMSEDPIPNLRKMFENYSSGYFKVPSVGAGTANTEFEVLTGMNLRYFGPGEYPYKTKLKNQVCESAATAFSAFGYGTHAIHNNGGNFYSRAKVFNNIGFESFTSKEFMNILQLTPNGWAKDEVLVDNIMEAMDTTEQQDFVFTVSVQGHGDYPEEQLIENPKIKVEGIDDEAKKNKWEYYVNMVYEMDQFAGDLVQAVEDRGEPAVVVYYGDHLPTMGLTAEDLKSRYLYNTNYVIWDNIGLEQQDRNIPAYQLMADVMNRLDIHSGTLFNYHQQRQNSKNYLSDLELLQYDILYGKQYVYKGNPPITEGHMEMGVKDATLTNIVPYLEKGYSLYGENFTKSSKVYVNGEKQKSTFLNNTRIVLPSTELSEGDVITVSQVGSSNTIFRTTDEYIYQGGQLVRQEGTGTDTTKSWTEQENEEK